jgi:hypothetical protein
MPPPQQSSLAWLDSIRLPMIFIVLLLLCTAPAAPSSAVFSLRIDPRMIVVVDSL